MTTNKYATLRGTIARAKRNDCQKVVMRVTLVEELLLQLSNAEKRIAELEASHRNLREAMAGIHNTITGGGSYAAGGHSECIQTRIRRVGRRSRQRRGIMITFTKEQLIASAHARIEFAEMMLAGELEPLKERTWSIELELARIALASLEAEAVAFNPAILDVASERQRQMSIEGWTSEHDDAYQNSELADAAACYAINAHNQGFSTPAHWPWDPEWWKQSGARRDLVKAGALILAEIERIDRAAKGEK